MVEIASRRRSVPRRTHRVIATLFLLTVAANVVAMLAGPPPDWITYAPLPPLFLLMATGLYMLLPLERRRAER